MTKTKLTYFFPLILLLLVISSAYADVTPVPQKISLTQKEKQWLDLQEEIRFSVTGNQEPVVFTNRDGTLDGIIPEYVNILSKVLNKKITLVSVSDNPLVVYKNAEQLQLHGHFSLFKNPAIDTFYFYSKSYIDTPLYVFASRDKNNSIKQMDDLRKKKVSILLGHQMMMEYVKGIEDVEIVVASTPKQQMEQLQYGEVDAIIGYKTYHYLIRKFFFDNIIPAFSSDKIHNVHAGILMKHPQLLSILDKAIVAIPPSIMQNITEKWLFNADMAESDGLTQKELDWLEKKHHVRARVSNWPPYMFKSPEASGISVDYLKFVAERYNIDVEFVLDDMGWEKSKHDLRTTRENYDIILTMAPTPERNQDFALSEPYLKMPWVIFAKDNTNSFSSIENLLGKTVAVERGFVIQEKLQTLYPEIIINEVDSSLAALKSVSTGSSDAYIGNLANSIYLIRDNGLDNLKVAAPTPFQDHLQTMAVRKDWPELASILSKAFTLMSLEEQNRIKNKWSSVRYEHGIQFMDIILWISLIIVLSAIIIFTISLVNKKLNREIENRNKIEFELEKHIQVVNENVMIATVDESGIIISASDLFFHTSKYSETELIGNSLDMMLCTDLKNNISKNVYETSLNKGIWCGEIKYSTREGDTLWVYARVSPIIGIDM